jgi:hypothetical protein
MHFVGIDCRGRVRAGEQVPLFAEAAERPENSEKNAKPAGRHTNRLSALGELRVLGEFACIAPGHGPIAEGSGLENDPPPGPRQCDVNPRP